MTAQFDIAYKITSQVEAGYTNNSKDRGGETYAGISRVFFPNWKGWGIIDAIKKSTTQVNTALVSNLQIALSVKEFYKENFWDTMLLSLVENQLIANELYDTGVNCGLNVAGTFLQRVLNVANQEGKLYPDLKVDGKVGITTIKALNSHPKPMNILRALNALQGVKYIEICEHNLSQEVFFNGWMTRVNEYCN